MGDTVRPAGEAALERAVFVISIDTEMAWGLNHRPGEVYRYPNERQDLRRLLELFDRYEIPATWAIVGHLMLDRCDQVGGRPHPEITRPEYDWVPGDWFARDPCTDAAAAPDWYAPDLLPLIQATAVEHEIASHGFSHMMAGEAGCSRAAYDSELRAAVAAAADRGVRLRSIIHPRNSLGHLDLLPEHGFVAYRGRRPTMTATRWQRLVDLSVGSDRTAVRPMNEGQVWNLPATIMFTIDPRPRTWRLWIRQVERRLDQAVRRRSMFHLWFHPHNLRDRPDQALAALDFLCRSAARHRDAGRLDTVTMGALASRLSGPVDAAHRDDRAPSGPADSGP